MAPTLSYKTLQTQIHEDPDGTLRIDIPPMGWRKAMGINSPLGTTIGILFASVGLVAPIAAIWLAERHEPGLPAMILAVSGFDLLTLLAIAAVVSVKARRSAHISVSPTELNIHEYNAPSDSQLRLPRDEIEFLGAGPAKDPDRETYLCVRRKRYDTSDVAIGHLPPDEIKRIAALIQDKLQLPAGARRSK